MPPKLNPATTVTVFTRHAADCRHAQDRYYRGKDCACTKWLYIYENGKGRRMTANTRTWKDAEAGAMKERLRLDPVETEKRRLAGLDTARNLHGGPVTVKDALEQWVRGLKAQTYSTSRSYKAFVGKVTRWAQRNSIAALQDVTPHHLDLGRSEWGLDAAHPDGRTGPTTQQQMQMRLKAFFKWATGLRKIAWNPTLSMGRIQSNPKRTIPLTQAQFELLVRELCSASSCGA